MRKSIKIAGSGQRFSAEVNASQGMGSIIRPEEIRPIEPKIPTMESLVGDAAIAASADRQAKRTQARFNELAVTAGTIELIARLRAKTPAEIRPLMDLSERTRLDGPGPTDDALLLATVEWIKGVRD